MGIRSLPCVCRRANVDRAREIRKLSTTLSLRSIYIGFFALPVASASLPHHILDIVSVILRRPITVTTICWWTHRGRQCQWITQPRELTYSNFPEPLRSHLTFGCYRVPTRIITQPWGIVYVNVLLPRPSVPSYSSHDRPQLEIFPISLRFFGWNWENRIFRGIFHLLCWIKWKHPSEGLEFLCVCPTISLSSRFLSMSKYLVEREGDFDSLFAQWINKEIPRPTISNCIVVWIKISLRLAHSIIMGRRRKSRRECNEMIYENIS